MSESVHLPEEVCEAGLEWSVLVRDLETGEALDVVTPERVVRTASIGKLFLLLRAARLLVSGEQDPDEVLVPGPDDEVADSGLWYLLREPGLRFADACTLVGAVSDNRATNVLIERIGIDAAQAESRALGYQHTALLDKVRDERTPDHPPTLSLGCATDLCDLAVRLAGGSTGVEEAQGVVLDPDVREQVNAWLGTDTDTSMVAGGFGLDPLAHLDADDGVVLRHKTGTIQTARCDVGWARNENTGRGVAWAVLVNWPDDSPLCVRLGVLQAMHGLGEALRRRIAEA